jgi:tRNA modification GTPase
VTSDSPNDTIAAIVTPPGRAGIGIIRLSGPLSHPIAKTVFQPKRAQDAFESHRLYLGHVVDPGTGRPVDEVLLSFMYAPQTYTREDIVEINSHSGYALLETILRFVLEQGARLARPGEFTLRAFLNGRIDLTQAEAVMDVINSRSEKGLFLASQHMSGLFGNQVEQLKSHAIHILASVVAAIDFPDEGLETASLFAGWPDAIENGLIKPVKKLIRSGSNRIWLEGINAVIAGRVNAGKSSLLNRLLNEERAIVTPFPGTTRDFIESGMEIEGVPFRLVDTAGFRDAVDDVEHLGISLTEKKVSEADLLLIVMDWSRPLSKEDRSILSRAGDIQAILVLNKSDLPCNPQEASDLEALPDFPKVRISALTGEGMDDLRNAMVETVLRDGSEGSLSLEPVGPNLRQQQALKQALGFFAASLKGTSEEVPLEIIALELKSGLDALGEIIGETTNEDVLDAVFSQFCLGK